MEKYIVECDTEQEWEEIRQDINPSIVTWESAMKQYSGAPVGIDVPKKQWAHMKFFKEIRPQNYIGYKFIKASEYLNKEPILLIFN